MCWLALPPSAPYSFQEVINKRDCDEPHTRGSGIGLAGALLYKTRGKGGENMALIQDMASFSIQELKLNRVEPSTEAEWSIVNGYLLEACK